MYKIHYATEDHRKAFFMRELGKRLYFYSTVVVMTTAVIFGTTLCGNQTGECREDSETAAPGPWVMVNLSPRGFSSGCKNVYSIVKSFYRDQKGIIVPFSRLTTDFVAETQPAFIILGPQGTPWCRYSGGDGVALQNFLWLLPLLVEEMNIPILGICGGHQALALAFGGKVGPIRAGAQDCLPYSRDRLRGVLPLDRVAPDPIFRGIGGTLQMAASHYDEVKVLPPGFVLLASGKLSPVQIMRHPTRPVYGIQGHPEKFWSSRPGGGVLIRNFLNIARIHNRTVRGFSATPAPELISSRR
jgi:GMP synthase (glutamine-hydrolysing)